MHHSGDREKTFLFPLERFPEVAAIVKPKRRRVLMEKQRCRLISLGQRHRYVFTAKFPSDRPRWLWTANGAAQLR
jgi:hypothetical protein